MLCVKLANLNFDFVSLFQFQLGCQFLFFLFTCYYGTINSKQEIRHGFKW